MKKSAMKISQTIIGAGLLVLLLATFINPSHCQADEMISINVSPNIINLDSIDHSFGVHTTIAYAVVNTDSVVLLCDGAELIPTVCFADSNDRLVAKFLTADLAFCELETGTDNTFTLTGEIKDSDPVELFSGEDAVLIIENQAAQQIGNGSQGTQSKWSQNR